MPKSRPILFSREMVEAVIDETKTQTRRTVTPQPDDEFFWTGKHFTHAQGFTLKTRCPYGEARDLLWVREEHYRFGHWEKVEGVMTKGGKQKWKFVADSDKVRYSDNPPTTFRKSRDKKTPEIKSWHKRLARFMPRSASRITLRVVGVTVERLNQISHRDALAEGVKYDVSKPDGAPCARFQQLWERINGRGSWAKNPRVWVVDFRRVTP